MSELPLAGIRVADFCWIGAGAYTTRLLADLGAEVIKIESTVHLDSLRLAPPFKDNERGVNRSGYFADRNSGKSSFTVNIKTEEGLNLVKELIAQSDIVTNNFSAGTMDRVGLGYETLREINPAIIFLGMSTHGSDGPESRALGYGATITAITSLMYLTAFPDGLPAGTGTNYPDHIPNPCHAVFAVLAALRYRRRTGKGQSIDIAQTETMLALMAPGLMDCSANGRNVKPSGNRHIGFSPRGVYPCVGDDRWIAISIETDAQWAELVDYLDGELLRRADWSAHDVRVRDCEEIDRHIAKLTAGHDSGALFQALQRRTIPSGIVQNAQDLVDLDPQLNHRGHWKRLDHKEMGRTIYNGLPFKYASVELGPNKPAPLLGEHTEKICRDLLGLSAGEVEALKGRGVLS